MINRSEQCNDNDVLSELKQRIKGPVFLLAWWTAIRDDVNRHIIHTSFSFTISSRFVFNPCCSVILDCRSPQTFSGDHSFAFVQHMHIWLMSCFSPSGSLSLTHHFVLVSLRISPKYLTCSDRRWCCVRERVRQPPLPTRDRKCVHMWNYSMKRHPWSATIGGSLVHR